MHTSDFSLLSAQDIANLIQQITPHALESLVTQIPSDQLASVLTRLTPEHDFLWREKLAIFFHSLDEYSKLEQLGRVLNLQQLQEISDYITTDTSLQWKLSPLLVGIPYALFETFFYQASTSQLETLHHNIMTEAVQHHLTLLTHDTLYVIKQYRTHYLEMKSKIEDLDSLNLDRQELALFFSKLHDLSCLIEQRGEKISKILNLAWKADRGDLIDQLSLAKEFLQKLSEEEVGHSKLLNTSLQNSYEGSNKGLYNLLEKKLEAVFGNPLDLKNIEALKDDESVLEALVRFSIWYLEDYKELGLLPSTSTSVSYDASLPFLDLRESSHQATLFMQVRQNLSKLGLTTVKDLKTANIFSKKMLQDYINEHRDCLV